MSPKQWPWLSFFLLVGLCGCFLPSFDQLEKSLKPLVPPDWSRIDPRVAARARELETAVESAKKARDRVALGQSFGDLGIFFAAYMLVDAAQPCLENARLAQPSDVRWPYLLGFLDQIQGRADAAAAAYGQVLALDPDHVGARLRLAEIEIEAGRLVEAETALRALVGADPNLAAARFQLSRVLQNGERLEDAVRELEEVVRLQPRAGAAHYSLALLRRRLGREPQAIPEHVSELVIYDDPLLRSFDSQGVSAEFFRLRGDRALQQGDFSGAVDYFRKTLEHGGGRSDRLYLAGALIKAGKRLEGRTELEAAVAAPILSGENPSEIADARRGLAVLELEEGRPELAVTLLEQALAVDPAHEDAAILLADLLVEKGRQDAALELLARLLERKPESALALHRRARIYLTLRRPEAATDLARAATLAPKNAEIRFDLAQTRAVSQPQEAKRDYLAAADAAPKGPSGALLRLLAFGRAANLERAGGEIEAAEKHYRLALLEGPAPEVLLNLADLLLEKGEFAEAGRLYAALLAKDPKMGEARLGEVNALILGGDWAGARQKLEGALTEDPPSGALVHLMARLLASAPDQGQRDGARSLHLAETILRARPSSFHAETLALALAENGRFPEAISVLDRLLVEGGARESRAVVEYWRALRSSFVAGQAWRASPPGRFFRPR